ncbi:MAG: hypothetical protein ACRCY9_01920, partial [Phycicoccus sp.]
DRLGVTIKGENALDGGVRSDLGWDNIVNAIRHAAYSGLTVLRIDDVVHGVGRDRYRDLIETQRPDDAGPDTSRADAAGPSAGTQDGVDEVGDLRGDRPGDDLDLPGADSDVPGDDPDLPGAEESFGPPRGVEPVLEVLEWGGLGGGEVVGIGPATTLGAAVPAIGGGTTGATVLGGGVLEDLPPDWSPLRPGVESAVAALVGQRGPADMPDLTRLNRLWDGIVAEVSPGVAVRIQLVPAGGTTRAGWRTFFGSAVEVDDAATPGLSEVSFPYSEIKSESAWGPWHTGSLSVQAKAGGKPLPWLSVDGAIGGSGMVRSRQDFVANGYTTSISAATGSGSRATFVGDAVLRLSVVDDGAGGDGAATAPVGIPVKVGYRLPLELTRPAGLRENETGAPDPVVREWRERGWVPVAPARQRDVLTALVAAETFSFGSLPADAATVLGSRLYGTRGLPPGPLADALAAMLSQKHGERHVRDLGAGIYSMGIDLPPSPQGTGPRTGQLRLQSRVVAARVLGVVDHGFVALSKVRRMRGDGMATEFGAGARVSAGGGVSSKGPLTAAAPTLQGSVGGSVSGSAGVDSNSISGVFDADLTWERAQVAPSGPMARVLVSMQHQLSLLGGEDGHGLDPVERSGTAVLLVPLTDLPGFMAGLEPVAPEAGSSGAPDVALPGAPDV